MKIFITNLLMLTFCSTLFAQKKITVTPIKQAAASAYKVAISFHSIGTGGPENTAFIDYIHQFKKKQKIKTIAYYRVGPLGREGEYDMVFKLNELTATQSKSFINGLKKVALLVNKGSRGSASIETSYQLNKANLPPRASIDRIES